MKTLTHRCDEDRLESYLQGLVDVDTEHELTVHLDECRACRDRLQQLAAEPATWDEAELFLKPQEFDDEHAAERRMRQPLQIQHVIDALDPTDDPQMLGRLGGHEVSGVVGAGAMGVVLKAYDKSLDRTLAIKVMAPHLASHGAARKRFAREAKAAAAVLHPNVMAIHSVSNDGSLPYLVMPYVAGASLQKRLDDEGPLPTIEVLRIGAQIAAGLQAAHEQGLVHRDIKPANILLENGVERVAITDFGLARAVDDATLTRSGVIAGTPQYMSPEQARGEAVDTRSDLFSLGSVLYALCTGHLPFRAETSYGVLRRITDTEPRPIREINPDVPDWLSEIIAKLMSKRPADRFTSAGQVADLLGAWLAHLQQPDVIPRPQRIRQPGTSAGGRRGSSRVIKYLLGAASSFVLLLLAGIVIVLEVGKGTLRIECAADSVPVRITKGDKVVERLTLTKAGATVRIAAGNYIVEIEGEPDGITIQNGSVELQWRGQQLVQIVATVNAPQQADQTPASALPPAEAEDSPNASDSSAQPADQQRATIDSAAANEKIQQWVSAARTLGADAPARRQQAIEQIRQALHGEDRTLQFAALKSLSQLGDVDFDKQPFRGRILELIKTDNGEMLDAAFYALYNCDRRAEDLALLQQRLQVPLVHHDAIHRSASHLLQSFAGGAIEGPSEEIVSHLLRLPDRSIRREVLRGLWGARVSDALAAQIIVLVDDPASHHDAIYFALSTFPDKNAAVVDKLITELSDPDWNNWDRALWGLGYGVPEAQQTKVAAALLDMVQNRSDPRTREKCTRLIRQYGTAAQKAELERLFAASTATTDQARDLRGGQHEDSPAATADTDDSAASAPESFRQTIAGRWIIESCELGGQTFKPETPVAGDPFGDPGTKAPATDQEQRAQQVLRDYATAMFGPERVWLGPASDDPNEPRRYAIEEQADPRRITLTSGDQTIKGIVWAWKQQMVITVALDGGEYPHTFDTKDTDHLTLRFARDETDPVWLRQRVAELREIATNLLSRGSARQHATARDFLAMAESWEREAGLREQAQIGKAKAKELRKSGRNQDAAAQEQEAELLRIRAEEERAVRVADQRRREHDQRFREKLRQTTQRAAALRNEGRFAEAEVVDQQVREMLRDRDPDLQRANELKQRAAQARLDGNHPDAELFERQAQELLQQIRQRYEGETAIRRASE